MSVANSYVFFLGVTLDWLLGTFTMTRRQALLILRQQMEVLQNTDYNNAVRFFMNAFRHDHTVEGPRCLHCGEADYDYYMLKDALWEQVTFERRSIRGTMHLGCVEARLGRKLIANDFKDLRMNQAILYLLQRDSI